MEIEHDHALPPTMIDLFAGCGGVTTGFKAAGYVVLAAVENDPIAAMTYRLNHPEVMLCEADIRRISPQSLGAKLNARALTVLCASPPCQPFSRHNRLKKGYERADLTLEIPRFAEVLRPAFLFIENVPGLMNDLKIINQLINLLGEIGYKVAKPKVVNGVYYGIPQFRKRCIILATRLEVPLDIPQPTHLPPQYARRLGKATWLTVRDAFAGLPPLQSGECSPDDPLHRARRHHPLSLKRLQHISPNGGSRTCLPDDLQLACHKRSKRTVGYCDVYGRMDFDKPANTLTTGCTNFTKGRFAHPVFDRSITPREAARLQTFPDDYAFFGNYEQISTQIGNAVPVRFAELFARHFIKLIEQAKTQCTSHHASYGYIQPRLAL